MNSRRYLNTILTVVAVLLALQLWTSWSAAPAPVLVSPAVAQDQPGGIPNAAAQRKQMVDLLKKVAVQNDQLMALLKSGQVRVRVEAGAGGQ